MGQAVNPEDPMAAGQGKRISRTSCAKQVAEAIATRGSRCVASQPCDVGAAEGEGPKEGCRPHQRGR